MLRDPKAVHASTASVCSLCLGRMRANIFSLVSSVAVLSCVFFFFCEHLECFSFIKVPSKLLKRFWKVEQAQKWCWWWGKQRSLLSRCLKCKRLISPVTMLQFWRVSRYEIWQSCFIGCWHGLPRSKNLVGSVLSYNIPHMTVSSKWYLILPSLQFCLFLLISLAPLLHFFISNAETVILIYTPSSSSSMCPHPSFLPCRVSLYYLSQGQNQPVDHSLLLQVLPTEAAAWGFILMARRHELTREERRERESERGRVD